ncbi:MAG TPA: GH116 family glycosyl hydrolase, partial [Fimbriimonas sp.]|nr:GH116 family glycosyl hydrolase [Fimbriimonas sp.]
AHADAASVAKYVQENAQRFYTKTKTWHDVWYDSTLPYWFLDRTMANTSILASTTCTRFATGRFYAWEGVGCCEGTCGHVWGYAQAAGRLFPALERSVREQADYEPTVGFNQKTGAITFRGEFANSWAADSQAGYILRTYREHQTSPDSEFLKRVYPRMKKALQFLIKEDMDGDGILEGQQHNTLDVDLFGPSSWLTSYYLAALRAGEEMAKEMGDSAFAKQCRTIFGNGSSRFNEVFWNGEYFVHRLDLDKHPEGMRMGNGCSIDQLMGQMWAHQVGLGRVVDAQYSKKALQALFKYNFLSDIGPFLKEQKAGRWYAVPGEAGLLMCTFPLGDRKEILGGVPTWASMYFNEVWTGCEYEAASHMIDEGLVEEGFRVVKAAHDRHHPSKRNPWNEIECSDHYARAMASYGAFISASGFTYHGPKGQMGFAPKVAGANFRCAFTAAEGWGTYDQNTDKMGATHLVILKHGKLKLNQLSVMSKGKSVSARINGRPVPATISATSVIKFKQSLNMKEGDVLTVKVSA